MIGFVGAQGSNVKIEFKIGRACQRKRKDSFGNVGRLVVIVEETRELVIKPEPLMPQCPCISVPLNQFFSVADGAVVSELHLFVKATFSESALIKNGMKIGDVTNANGEKASVKSPKPSNNKPVVSQGKKSSLTCQL